LPEAPSSDGEDVRLGFELHTGLPWSGYKYQPDLSSMSLIQDVVPLVAIAELVAIAVPVEIAVLVPVAGAEIFTERDAVSRSPSDCTALIVKRWLPAGIEM
jgi:hypothetical protein